MQTMINRALLPLSFVGLLSVTVMAAPLTSGGPGGVGTTDGLSSLELWLRGDKGVTLSGSGVTGWADQSGNGNNAVPNSLAQLPLYVTTQNSMPVITFNPTNPASPGVALTTQYFRMASGIFTIGGNTNATTYASFTVNNPVYGNPFFGRSPVNWFGLHSNNDSPVTVTAYQPGGSQGTTINGTFGGNFALGDWAVVQGTHGNLGAPINYTDFTIGADAGGTGLDRLMNGRIGEIIIYNNDLNTAQRTLVQNYLGSKYNTAIGGFDRYDGDTALKGDYDQGVFGVIDVGGTSVTNSGLDGFGIEVQGVLGANQGALAGHKVLNNSLLVGTSIGPQLAADVWERSWYVDSDETFGATIGFNSADAGLGALDISQEYFVLFRDTEVGDWSVLGQGSINGDLVSLNVGTLLSGYYTLAFNVNYLPEPSSLTIFACGAICLAARSRRRRKPGQTADLHQV